MTTIYLLPGIGGTALDWNVGFGIQQEVWGDDLLTLGVQQMLPFHLDRLPLKPDGTSKFDISATNTLNSDYYGDLIKALSVNFDVIPLGYDWRFLPSQCASRLTIGAPGWFVCHSMGGLVAAHLYDQLQGRGQESKMLGVIALGTPWGLNAAGDAVDVLFGKGSLIGVLADLYCAGKLLFPNPALLKLKFSANFAPMEDVLKIIQTWSSFSTLIPNTPPQWRTRAAYATAPAYADISQGWLDRGRDENDRSLLLAQQLPPRFVAEIIGTGFDTWDQYDTRHGSGDRVVPNTAKLVTFPVFELAGVNHSNLPDTPVTVDIIRLLISQNFPAAATLDLTSLTGRGARWYPDPYAPTDAYAYSYASRGPGPHWPDP